MYLSRRSRLDFPRYSSSRDQGADKGSCANVCQVSSAYGWHRARFYRVSSAQRSTPRIPIHEALPWLSNKCHPDANNDPRAQGKFRRISEAYATLGHDRTRYVGSSYLLHPDL